MKLSVLMITYNQEKFVAQAVESVLMQKLDFPWEIVIGDDCSSDGTLRLLLDYQRRFPERIRLLPSGRNLGVVPNVARVLDACRGEYVALLEGDDYWTSPQKLQKQVDFLDSHPECVICFTNSSIVDEAGNAVRAERLEADRKRNLTQAQVLYGLVPPTNTVVFRNNILGRFPECYYGCVNGDILLFSSLTAHGAAGYLDSNTAAYRIHSGGLWSSTSDEYRKRNNLKTRLALLETFGASYRSMLLPLVQCCYRELMEHYRRSGEPGSFLRTWTGYSGTNLRYRAFSAGADLRCLASGLWQALAGSEEGGA